MSENNVTANEVYIRAQGTPNPQALKFILNQPVKTTGKATYNSAEDTYGNILASALLQIDGSEQIHMFENVITVTFSEGKDPYEGIDSVVDSIKKNYPLHDPNFTVEGDKKEQRKELSPEVQEIEEILDRTIRPGLQADGGDVTVLSLHENQLEIRYEGACGTCPSATMGTLQAIEGILRAEYNPELMIVLEGYGF